MVVVEGDNSVRLSGWAVQNTIVVQRSHGDVDGEKINFGTSVSQ